MHKNVKNSEIKCFYPNCTTESVSYSNFRQHIARYHNNVEEGFYFCKYKNCDASFSNIKLLRKHNLLHIQKTVNDNYSCGFCETDNAEFKTINAYQIHISRYHKLSYDSDVKSVETESYSDCTEYNQFREDNAETQIDNEIRVSNKTLSDNDSNNVTHIFSDLYATLSSKHLATEPLIQNVVDSISQRYNVCSQK